jgi:hypothetical protein
MSLSISPRSRRRIASLRWCGVSLKGRPKLCPRALARAAFASAGADQCAFELGQSAENLSIKRPCAVVVSAHASASGTRSRARWRCRGDVWLHGR